VTEAVGRDFPLEADQGFHAFHMNNSGPCGEDLERFGRCARYTTLGTTLDISEWPSRAEASAPAARAAPCYYSCLLHFAELTRYPARVATRGVGVTASRRAFLLPRDAYMPRAVPAFGWWTLMNEERIGAVVFRHSIQRG
jgi:hypothetical protein